MYSSSYFNLGPRSVWVVKATTGTLPPEKTSYSLCTRLDGPQSLRVRKSLPPQGFTPRTVQPVASGYTTEISRADCTQYCYIMDTFPSPSHSRNNSNQIHSSWRVRQHFPPKHQNKLFNQKRRKNSMWSWPLLCIQLLPGSKLNTENGCTDFGVSVVLFGISRKISGYTVIRPRPHPDTFLSTSHI